MIPRHGSSFEATRSVLTFLQSFTIFQETEVSAVIATFSLPLSYRDIHGRYGAQTRCSQENIALHITTARYHSTSMERIYFHNAPTTSHIGFFFNSSHSAHGFFFTGPVIMGWARDQKRMPSTQCIYRRENGSAFGDVGKKGKFLMIMANASRFRRKDIFFSFYLGRDNRQGRS